MCAYNVQQGWSHRHPGLCQTIAPLAKRYAHKPVDYRYRGLVGAASSCIPDPFKPHPDTPTPHLAVLIESLLLRRRRIRNENHVALRSSLLKMWKLATNLSSYARDATQLIYLLLPKTVCHRTLECPTTGFISN